MEKGRRGPTLQGNAQGPAVVWPSWAECGLQLGAAFPLAPEHWWFWRQRSEGQGGMGSVFTLPRGWETALEGAGQAASIAVGVDHQPISHISSLGPRAFVTFTLHLKCSQCGLATGNSVCHTQSCVSQSAFLLSRLSGSFEFFLAKLGQRFLPVDLNLNFLKKLPGVPCQQWTLPWGEARVSP